MFFFLLLESLWDPPLSRCSNPCRLAGNTTQDVKHILTLYVKKTSHKRADSKGAHKKTGSEQGRMKDSTRVPFLTGSVELVHSTSDFRRQVFFLHVACMYSFFPGFRLELHSGFKLSSTIKQGKLHKNRPRKQQEVNGQ